jgi:uncharacterized protein YdiU (UPF0061 family)
MKADNPAIIPRNHKLEEVINSAVNSNDLNPAIKLITALSSPFEEREEYIDYMLPPEPHQIVHRTFCGT